MTKEFLQLINEISPVCTKTMQQAKRHWNNIAKPIKALGVLETDINKIAAIQQTKSPKIDKKALVIFCSDNGITKENVTQTDVNTTFMVAKNMTKGLSSTQYMAKKAQIDVKIIDVGMFNTLDDPNILNLKVQKGTKDFLVADAMTKQECIQTILAGAKMADTLLAQGYNLFMAGEMGIGNTTTSAAVCCVLLQKPAKQVAGRGAGLSYSMLQHKIAVIEQGIQTRKPNPNATLDVLCKLGGFDIAAMLGFYLGCAKNKVPVILDGLISQVAALCATRLCPQALQYMLLSHIGKEKASALLIKALQKKDKTLKPAIKADFKLGEGSGAVALCPLLDMALSVYDNMISFRDMKLDKYKA